MYEEEKDWKIHGLKGSTAQLKDLLRNTFSHRMVAVTTL